MKKAFDQNVSRAKPRLRLGVAFTEAPTESSSGVEGAIALHPSEDHGQVAPTEEARDERSPTRASAKTVLPDKGPDSTSGLREEVKARVERAQEPRVPVVQKLTQALAESPAPNPVVIPVETVAKAPVVRADAMPREPHVEVQNPKVVPAPVREVPSQEDLKHRRERLKERLKAVRENPRPEPLPPSVAQAGVLAVERIATLQEELNKTKALNLALTQDLEVARRTAERSTTEARLRMDEAQRLANEMEGRVNLLRDLEKELASVEAERDESLLALQDSRQRIDAQEQTRVELESEVAKRDQSLADSLQEEERLAGELEASHDDARALRRTLETLRQERDTLARQVSDLSQERSELLDARKALEAVHRALAQAVSR
jgi:hypothetical protein